MVSGALVHRSFLPEPQRRANISDMLDDLRVKKTSFTATLESRAGSLPSEDPNLEKPIFVDVGRELKKSRRQKEALASMHGDGDATERESDRVQ